MLSSLRLVFVSANFLSCSMLQNRDSVTTLPYFEERGYFKEKFGMQYSWNKISYINKLFIFFDYYKTSSNNCLRDILVTDSWVLGSVVRIKRTIVTHKF